MRAPNALPFKRYGIRYAALLCLLLGSVAANAIPPESEVFGPFPVTGVIATSCGSYDVINDFTISVVATSYFDKSGNVVRIREFTDFSESVYYNSVLGLSGPVLVGQEEKAQARINFIKNENLLIVNEHGFMVKPPGGGVIFLTAGRILIDLTTGEVISAKGRLDTFKEDAQNRLCTALAGP